MQRLTRAQALVACARDGRETHAAGTGGKPAHPESHHRAMPGAPIVRWTDPETG